MTAEEIELRDELKQKLIRQVKGLLDLNEASWGYEEGVLITGHDANLILTMIEKIEREKDV